MDRFFNYAIAADLYDEIMKMDDDSAAGFMQAVNFDLLTNDLYNNRKFVSKAVGEITNQIRDEIAPRLVKKNDEEALAAAALVGLVSKANDHWKREKRVPAGSPGGGRFTKFSVQYEREKKPGPRTAPEGREDFNVTQAIGRGGDAFNEFQTAWSRRADSPGTNQHVYDRIQAGADAAQKIPLGPKYLAAAALAEQAGKYGPEAEKIVGPTIRRTAYRYRGTEKAPDAALRQSYNVERDAVWRESGSPATQHAGGSVRTIDPSMRTEAAKRAAVKYFLDPKNTKAFPQKKLAALQLASGKLPPSQGVVIAADGHIVAQAVGYNEDHFLPFNLKNLKGLRGGSYVRTRSSGGLTTEDVYAGLMSGAREVTVVSRSGVFTMRFDDSFRGGRRYNDKAVQMVKRYGQTLDAVKSEQVTKKGLSLDERAKIRAQIENDYSAFGETPAVRAEIETAIAQAVKERRSNPYPTEDEIAEIDAQARAGNENDDRAYSKERAKLFDAKMEEKASNKYRLDGEGYKIAMEALEEQFPYYIDKVQVFDKLEGVENDFSGETDAGYVKPRFLRPERVQEGYFDTSIRGSLPGATTGKVSADKTNYQNYRQNRPVEPEKTEEGTPAAATATAPAAPVGVKEQARINQQAEALVASREQQDVALKRSINILAPWAPRGEDYLYGLINDEKINEALRGPQSQRERLYESLRATQTAAAATQNNDAANDAAREAGIYLDALDIALKQEKGGEKWAGLGSVRPGYSPDIPYDFSDRGGVFRAGEPAQAYKDQLVALTERLGMGYDNEASDNDLKAASRFFGELSVDVPNEDPVERTARFLRAKRDLPEYAQETAQKFITGVQTGSAEMHPAMRKQLLDLVDAAERARAVKLASGGALNTRPSDRPAIAGGTLVFDSGKLTPVTPKQAGANADKHDAALLELRRHADQVGRHDDELGIKLHGLAHTLEYDDKEQFDDILNSLNEAEQDYIADLFSRHNVNP